MAHPILSSQQAEALSLIEQAIKEPPRARGYNFLLNGLAGTGKTTVAANLARKYPNVLLVTLTGKAASVLREKTNLPACTIHSAIYQLVGEEYDKRGKKKPVFAERFLEDELCGKIIVVDECSMISENIGRDLSNTGAKIIALGDPGQLPPIQGKPFYDNPNYVLTEIHRQALESPIIRQAHAVRTNGKYAPDGADFRIVSFSDSSEEDLINADVVLCWKKATVDKVNKTKRKALGYDKPTPFIGEPLLCHKNVNDIGIFNGATYTLAAPFEPGDTNIIVLVEGRPITIENVRFENVANNLDTHDITTWFSFGYASTVHKAQGSEWRNVVLIDEYHRQEYRREWLYTGITRASDKITIVRM
jgi:exodeoxyribonuclease-5